MIFAKKTYVWEGSNYVSLAASFPCIVNCKLHGDTVALKNKYSVDLRWETPA